MSSRNQLYRVVIVDSVGLAGAIFGFFIGGWWGGAIGLCVGVAAGVWIYRAWD